MATYFWWLIIIGAAVFFVWLARYLARNDKAAGNPKRRKH
jgi:hypothetical protein